MHNSQTKCGVPANFQLRGGLLSLLFITFSLPASEIHACSCRKLEEVGFLRAAGTLPSNALGVLYRTPDLSHVVASFPGFTLVGSRPIKVGASNFKIIQRDTSTSLAVTIEEVGGPKPPQIAERKIYYTSDTKLQACLTTRTAQVCAQAELDITKDNWKSQLLATNRLEDVTDLAIGSGTLLRIRPSSGFVEGKQYTMQSDIPSDGAFFTLAQASDLASLNSLSKPDESNRFSSEATITITGPLSMNDFAKFTIRKSGGATHQIYLSCGLSYAAETQILEFEMPQRYESYRRQLLYFTEVMLPNASSKEPSFSTWNYGGYCPVLSPLKYNLGRQQETVHRICTKDNLGKSTQEPIRVRGKIAFWEMSDQFFFTPEIVLRFDETQNTACAKF